MASSGVLTVRVRLPPRAHCTRSCTHISAMARELTQQKGKSVKHGSVTLKVYEVIGVTAPFFPSLTKKTGAASLSNSLTLPWR
jgi:hypothetical protein